MAEKTEQPTPKRLRDAREKGDVCKGQDVSSAATVLAIAFYAIVRGDSIFATLSAMMTATFEAMRLPFREALSKCVEIVVDGSVSIVLPIVVLVMGVALASLLAQTGFLFAPKAAAPKLENLSPAKWFRKVFSMKNLFELVKNIVKVFILCAVVYYVLSRHAPDLFRAPEGGIGAAWALIGSAIGELLLISAGAFAVVAAIDYLYQRYKWNTEHMMSMEEVKREYKEDEGDPEIKSRRKQLHRELLNQNTLGNVRKAKVLVTNPTHFAVAIDYEKDRTPLPVILAKGEGELARRMIEVAEEEGIPVMRNVPLDRALYAEGTENAYIPKDLLAPVAEVLRWVEGLNRH